ncbi:unnamed protein product [Effrenium voratum]|uniref:Major facilitator superfamily (MFS) profile domain-containing protein n=1 Tax=Effrenium voratum TaxID=2562239 RepID=A0AA36JHT3_9DINO|nr:unnamed protein product [Effrenium voratum]CAJ1426673.1 unnamed protein product [Effrenium voratum]
MQWRLLLLLCSAGPSGGAFNTCDDVSELKVSLLQSSVHVRSREQHQSSHTRSSGVHRAARVDRWPLALSAALLLCAGCYRSLSSRASIAEMPKILIFVFWMSWYQYFSGDPFDAFVESMAQCPWPAPVGGRCPAGSRLQGSFCVPEPSDSPEWSLSARCADKSLVLSKAARLNGINASSASAVTLLTVLLAGAYMDRIGRKPVILFFLLSSILVKILLSFSCFLSWSPFVMVIIAQNVLEVMSASPVYPALNCMISDLTRGDEKERGDCFSALEVTKNSASLLALISGYPVLRAHQTSYLLFWASLALVSIAACAFFWRVLPETRKSEQEAPASVWRSLCEGLNCCLADAFLGQYLVLWAIISLAVNSAWGLSTMYLQSYIGMEQANASLCRALWFLALLAGSALSAPLMRQGVHQTHGAALLCMAAFWGLCALGGVHKHLAAPLFWVFGVGGFGVAYGVLTPGFGALVSSRAPPECQGQVFGLAVVVGTLLGIPLGPLWSQVFFDAAAEGWRATLPWLVSASLLALCGVWFFVISWLRREP